MKDLRNYILVTAAYWAFTLTDGALRMLVLLHFHNLGYTPLQIAFLFLFYEFFGVVTNLVGGWIGSRLGLNVTLWSGLALQVLALGMLALLSPEWSVAFSVGYVMAAQALSGIAKDLTKMSSKSAIKLLVPEDASGTLFKWVSLLTGSKNALKGVGFFLGGLLLETMDFVPACLTMAGLLLVILAATVLSLGWGIGKAKSKVKFTQIFSKSPEINILSAARFFLFGSRDVWFVVGLPVFLQSTLGWRFTEVGAFLALWVIGYGIVQSFAPAILRRHWHGQAPQGQAAQTGAFVLAVIAAGIAAGLHAGLDPAWVIIIGLTLFGIAFAINSAVHSYLILAYTDGDKVALNVGFYYMANAGGRLVGTVLSGLVYQAYGLEGCLWVCVAMVTAAGVISWWLPNMNRRCCWRRQAWVMQVIEKGATMVTLFRVLFRTVLFTALGVSVLATAGGVISMVLGFLSGDLEGAFGQGAYVGAVFGIVFGPVASVWLEWSRIDVRVTPPTFRREIREQAKIGNAAGEPEAPTPGQEPLLPSARPIVLFLCTENAARSQMAEALMKKHAPDRFQVFSAGMEPKEIHPLTVRVMSECGIDISSQRSKSLKSFLGNLPVRLAISVCEPVEVNCPTTWPGAAARLIWPFENPSAYEGPEEEKLGKFREVRDQIDRKIRSWLLEIGTDTGQPN